MHLSIEKALLMVFGLSVLLYSLQGPVQDSIDHLMANRDRNSVNSAVKAIDMAIINSMGGGISDTYVFLPGEVALSCQGGKLTVRARNETAGIRYPFTVYCGGIVKGYGRFIASWKEEGVTVCWSGIWDDGIHG